MEMSGQLTPTVGRGKTPPPTRKRGKYKYSAYWYLAPAGLIILVFHILPIFYTLGLSFFKQDVPEPAKFVGTYNYEILFSDPDFYQALRNTVYYVIGAIPTGILLALLIAMLLNTKIKGLGFYRVLYFLPVVTAINAVALVWKWIYHPQNYGLLNFVKNLFYKFLLRPIEYILLPVSSTGTQEPSMLFKVLYFLLTAGIVCAFGWLVYFAVSRLHMGMMRFAFFLGIGWGLGRLYGWGMGWMLQHGLAEFQKHHIVMVLLCKIAVVAFFFWILVKWTTSAPIALLRWFSVLVGMLVCGSIAVWAGKHGFGGAGESLGGFFSLMEERQDYLNDVRFAMPAIIVMSVWKGLGHNIIIFLAGLQNVPGQLYEASKIDGAGAWDRFRHITWPLISPTTFFILIMSTISSFQVFAQVYMMTPTGGPLNSTSVIVFYLYQKAFAHFEMGYAAAVALVLFTIIMTMTMIQRTFLEKKVHYA